MKKPNRKGNRTGGRRKARDATLAAGAALMLPVASLPALAQPPATNQLPTGGVVAAGAASIAQSGTQMTVTQTGQKAVVNWETFNVGANATVVFKQPNTGSATLNRVSDPNPSQIYGHIQANGQVFLTNPSGVYFAPGASVDVGGLVATTHSIGDADFMAGKNTLERKGATGKVTNDGTLKASLGGYIALLAPEVRNNGVIVAQMGTVALAAGEAYTLRLTGEGALTDLQATPATVNALVRNRHAVQAPGGLIILSALAVNQLRGSVVNSGQLEAGGLVNDGGTIRLRASSDITIGGTVSADAAPAGTGNGGSVTAIADLTNKDSRVTVKGSISARGGNAGGKGGFVETSGGRVRVKDKARVDTRAPRGKSGQWLIDPDGFTVASSGGDITGATLSANLATGDVSILSTNGQGSGGNVTVNDAVTWSANTLTLTATNDVNINAVMTANNTAKLDLEPGSGKVNIGFNGNGTFRGRVDFFQADGTTPRSGTGFLTIGGAGFTVITSVGASGSTTTTDLQGINGNAAGNYALGANIDASATAGWSAGAGFDPLGSLGFTGIFDGLGHTINGLVINRPTSTNSVGLFSYGKGATIRNVGVVGGSITGSDKTGGLLGIANSGSSISNVYATASVSGGDNTGGLVGYLYDGTLSKSYASGTVNGGNNVGGLVGQGGTPSISMSFSTGAVSGGGDVGGLVGKQSGGSLTDIYATGAVTATGNEVGGLLGANAGTAVSRGLAANTISATGTGIGALVGVQTSGSVANSFYNTTLSGGRTGFGNGTVDSSGVVLGKTTTQLSNVATYEAAGWSIGVNAAQASGYAGAAFLQGVSSTTWSIGYLPVYVRLVAGSSTYGNAPVFTYAIYDASSGGNLITDVTGSGTATWSTPLTGASSAGTYGEIYAGGLTASRTGYTFNSGTVTNWTIVPRPITVQASNQSRIYGAANPGSGEAMLVGGNLVNNDTLGSVVLTSSATSSTAAGQTASLTPSSLSMASGNASNYSVTYTDGTLTINQAPLTIAASSFSKIYNGQAYSGGGGVSYSGFVNGEGVSVLSGTLSYGGSSQGAVNAGSYAITPGGLTSGNYAITYSSGTLAIGQAPLTIAASNFSKTYNGQAYNGGSGVSYSGFVNGESVSVLGGTLNYGGSSQGAINAGSYAIVPSGLTSNNYAITYGSGTLTVGQAPLTIAAGSFSKTYNGQAYSGGNGVSYSGFVNGEGVSVLGGTLNYGGSSQGAINAGSYAITPSGLTSNNYAITYAGGTLTVGQAPLTVVASGFGKTYNGQAYTGGNGVSYSGFVNGEGVSVLGGTLSYGGSSQGAVNAGSYAITPGGLTSNNYAITYGSGTLTVGTAPLTVVANGFNKTYDGQAYSGGNGVSYSGFINGEGASSLGGTLIYGGSSQGAVAAGNYAIVPGGLASTNYTITYVGGTLAILPEVPPATTVATVTPASPVAPPSTPLVTVALENPTGGVSVPVAGAAAPGNSITIASSGAIAISSGTVSAGNPPNSSNPPSSGTAAGSATPPSSGPKANSGTIESSGGTVNSASSISTGSPPPGGDPTPQAVLITAAISVELLQTVAPGNNGMVTVSVPKEILSQSGSFTFKLPDQITEGGSANDAIVATTAEGAPLPNWLRFNADSKTFVASNVPDGGLPITVAVFINGQRTDLTIADRA